MNSKLAKWIAVFFVLLLVNTAYVAAFASPTIFYMTNVLFHIGLGTVLFAVLAFVLARDSELRKSLVGPFGFFLVAVALGVFLSIGPYAQGAGNLRQNRWAFWSHIVAAGFGVAMLFPWISRKARENGGGWVTFRKAFIASAALLVIFPSVTAMYRTYFPNPDNRIVNPLIVPTKMEDEGGGSNSPFFPSAAKTNVGGIIPSNFFMDSEACGQCHKDIYEQWDSSAHHFASFNNQFYRKSIEYMQSVVGTQPSKWCAGCHDHAVFFNGRFDRPMSEQVDTPEARAGLACTSCHAITHVNNTMGNGGYTIEYPPLHELATSKNKYIRALDRFLTFVNPEPHRESFMKPFMREDSSQYCSVCHKVHLDVPVNGYRWFRGFDEYDNWQSSGFGEGARSFYYPPKGQNCTDCHMPLVPSKDPGHHADGQIHSHRFPAANIAVPYANHDQAQLGTVERFLKSGFITVDIFSVSPIDNTNETPMIRRADQGPQLSSMSAVGEEAEQTGDVFIREVGKLAAPIDSANAAVEPGSTVRVDAVVRTRKIGHFFPGGTFDAFDIWLELQAKDATGKTIFWSGEVADNGKGPVDPGAHFYKAYQLDGDSNPINKRNAWQARTVLYVHAIPPGAADTVHFRMKIPKDAKGPLTISAKLNYRKFAYYYTQFAYAGKPKPGQEDLIRKAGNSAEYEFAKSNIPEDVAGEIKDEIPNVPIIVLAEATTKIQLGTPKWEPIVQKKDRERWNDWGIGLLLQGDLKGAEYAFKRTTEAEPGYADGWLNVARALITEGETDAAKPFIQKALEADSSLGRIYYFKGLIAKTDGDYDGALEAFRITESKYPRDRVVLNQIARILFLKHQYADALKVLQRVCLIDPEDLQMHYTSMLCYRGLRDNESSAREEKLFRRYKAEESSQSITAKRRMISPEDNNERQPIHDHDSVMLQAVNNTVHPKPAPAKIVRQSAGTPGGSR
jgi:tetratricopeptide (TPR) repeat protein